MSFQIDLDKYERAYGHFLHKIQSSIQQTFAEEEEERGLTQSDIARELKIDKASVSRRLNGTGNVTLRTISDLFTAMDREPLSNFSGHGSFCQYAIGGPPTANTNMYLDMSNYGSCFPIPNSFGNHMVPFDIENSYYGGIFSSFSQIAHQTTANRRMEIPVFKEYQLND